MGWEGPAAAGRRSLGGGQVTSVGPSLLWGRHRCVNVDLMVLLWRVFLPTHLSQGGQPLCTERIEKTVRLDSFGVSGLGRK